jgi:hypothetical protein
MLARVGGEFIDYRDLAERHLGTIYEGLLEYHLEPIRTEERGLRTELTQLASNTQSSALSPQSFTIGLLNDRGERYRTGSYYTPDFVVQYIVEQTLRPVLDAAAHSCRSSC